MTERKTTIQEALDKFDEKNHEKLAERIAMIAEEQHLSPTQKNYIRFLKVFCPIALIFSTPILAYMVIKLQEGLDPLIVWLTLVPFAFIVTIATIVNILIKTPN